MSEPSKEQKKEWAFAIRGNGAIVGYSLETINELVDYLDPPEQPEPAIDPRRERLQDAWIAIRRKKKLTTFETWKAWAEACTDSLPPVYELMTEAISMLDEQAEQHEDEKLSLRQRVEVTEANYARANEQRAALSQRAEKAEAEAIAWETNYKSFCISAKASIETIETERDEAIERAEKAEAENEGLRAAFDIAIDAETTSQPKPVCEGEVFDKWFVSKWKAKSVEISVDGGKTCQDCLYGADAHSLCQEAVAQFSPPPQHTEQEEDYYCPEHKYNPEPNSGMALCPQCEFPEQPTVPANQEALRQVFVKATGDFWRGAGQTGKAQFDDFSMSTRVGVDALINARLEQEEKLPLYKFLTTPAEQETGEPVAWEWQAVNGKWFPGRGDYLLKQKEDGKKIRPLYASPQPAEKTSTCRNCESECTCDSADPEKVDVTPQPVAPLVLTEEERNQIMDNCGLDDGDMEDCDLSMVLHEFNELLAQRSPGKTWTREELQQVFAKGYGIAGITSFNHVARHIQAAANALINKFPGMEEK